MTDLIDLAAKITASQAGVRHLESDDAARFFEAALLALLEAGRGRGALQGRSRAGDNASVGAEGRGGPLESPPRFASSTQYIVDLNDAGCLAPLKHQLRRARGVMSASQKLKWGLPRHYPVPASRISVSSEEEVIS